MIFSTKKELKEVINVERRMNGKGLSSALVDSIFSTTCIFDYQVSQTPEILGILSDTGGQNFQIVLVVSLLS